MSSIRFQRRLAASLLATSLLTMPGLAWAQEATELEEVVVTASATATDVRDAPASVSVITREEIERQPYQSLGELLGRLPGVTGGLSPSGALSRITIRGLPDNYTLILVDGRRLGSSRDITYRPDLGRQDLNWISPDMIERIEVVRGPMSSLYGSNAMGGVINIITRRISPDWRGSVNTSYTMPEQDDRGDGYQLGFNVGGPITETLGVRLGATYARTNPDELILSGNAGAAGVADRSVSGLLTWVLRQGQVLSLEGSWGHEEPLAPSTRTTSGAVQGAFGSESTRESLRLGYEGEWRFGNARLDIYHNAYVNEDQAEEGGTGEFSETVVDGLANFRRHLLWQHDLAVGAQYRSEELTNDQTIGTVPVGPDGTPVSGTTLSGDTAALFAEDQITLRDNLFLTLGARLDSNDRYGEHVSPRVYVVWHPLENWTVRGGIAQGFRAPSLKEGSAGAATFSRGGGCGSLTGLGYTGGGCYMAGNPDLDPEQSTNYEIGLGYYGQRYQASATYFHTNFENKIEYAALGFFQGRWWTQMENIQEARTRGLELTGSARVNPDIRLRASATWMMEAKNLVTGANLITAPEWSGYASIDWQTTDRLNLVLSAQYTGEQLGAGTTITDGYTTFDLTGGYDASESVTLRGGIQNLLDEEITGSSGFGYYSPGRRFFVGVSARF